MKYLPTFGLFTGMLLLAGCQSYNPKPLVPAEVLDEVLQDWQADTSPDRSAQTTFPQVAQWMSERNPDILELKAEYQTRKAVADIATTLANPELEFGLAQGRRMAVTEASRTQPFVSLAFEFPLSRVLKHEDDLNAALAQRGRAELLAKHRELYLELRNAWSELQFATERHALTKQLEKAARETLATGRKLEDLGAVAGVTLGLLNQELAGRRLDTLSAEADLKRTSEVLAALAGVSATRIQHISRLDMPDTTLPAVADLRRKLVADNANLAVLRSEYEVAERRLRLEISRQYPSIGLSPSFEQEVGEETQILGLGFSIEVPLFDLNKQGIAEAHQERNSAKVRYAAALRRALGAMEGTAEAHNLANQRLQLIRDELLPGGRETLAAAELALKSGEADVDILRFLELKQGVLELGLRLIEAREELLHELLKMERVVGTTLIEMGDAPKQMTIPRFLNDTETDAK